MAASWFLGLSLLLAAVLVLVIKISRNEDKQAGLQPNTAAKQPKDASSKVRPLWSFNWDATPPASYRPFKPIYHITMALQSSSPESLIVLDSDYKNRIEARRHVIASSPGMVMGVIPSPDGSSPEPFAKAVVDEIYAYLMAFYLPTRYPTLFRKETRPDGKTAFLHNKTTNTTFPCSPPADPLEAFRMLGETVDDDLFLLKEEELASSESDGGSTAYPTTGHRLVAFLCCCPSGFDPSAKLGLLLKDIHKPVPSYDKIGPSMERFFSRLRVGQSVKRLNWSVQTHTEFFAPVGNHIHEGEPVEMDADVDMDTARLRVECQTLTRLPQTKAVLFSFKTHLFPVKDIKAEGRGADLADAIEGLKEGNAPGMWTYKGAVRWGKNVCEYLRA